MKAPLLRLLISSLLLIVPLSADAQRSGSVYLKNGSVIRGDITTGSDGGVLVATPEGRLYTYRSDEILFTSLKPSTPQKKFRYRSRYSGGKFYEIDRAREIELGFGYGTGIGTNGTNVTSVALLSYSYRISPHFSFGGRVDFDHVASVERWYMPLVINVKGYLGPASGTQPFISLDVGGALGFRDGESDYGPSPHGWLLTPSVGIAIRLGKKTALNCYLGYRMQWVPEYLYTGGDSENPVRTGSLMMRMAFTIYHLK